jgi:hypothetical protein
LHRGVNESGLPVSLPDAGSPIQKLSTSGKGKQMIATNVITPIPTRKSPLELAETEMRCALRLACDEFVDLEMLDAICRALIAALAHLSEAEQGSSL